MFNVTVESKFSAAHNLRNYKGKCEKLHGHNYKVKVTVAGKVVNAGGMLVDFNELKDILEKIISKFDHEYLNEIPPFDKVNPTAENIAKYIYEKIESEKLKVKTDKVMVWETEKNYATYYER
jgi:6-pyruvoyltetrahydropterin/6-carboxytetrahydropterin synthase